MKKPGCFQVTKTAIIGIARTELTSHDGSGASGPSTVFTRPVAAEQPQPDRDDGDARRHVRDVVRGAQEAAERDRRVQRDGERRARSPRSAAR